MGAEVCVYDKKGRYSKVRLLRLYQCLVCMEKLPSHHALVEHKVTHKDYKPFECDHCNYKCRLKDIMKNHLEIQHGIKVNCNDIVSSKKSERMILDYKCTICNQQFESKEELHAHFASSRACKPYFCRHCEYKIEGDPNTTDECVTTVKTKPEPVMVEDDYETESDIWVPGEKNDKKEICKTFYRCMVCTKQFQSKSSLYRHNLTHYGSKPFGCSHCDYRSSLRGIMQNHLQIRHGIRIKITDIAPDKKDKMFIRTYKCTTCNKILATKEILQKHLTTNAGCKPFHCMFCNYRSSMKCTMKRHIQGKHGQTIDSSKLFPNRRDGVEIIQEEFVEDEKPTVEIETELNQIIPGIVVKEESMDSEAFSDIEEKYSEKLKQEVESLNHEIKEEAAVTEEYLDESKIQIKFEIDDMKFEEGVEEDNNVDVKQQTKSYGQVL